MQCQISFSNLNFFLYYERYEVEDAEDEEDKPGVRRFDLQIFVHYSLLSFFFLVDCLIILISYHITCQ